MASTNKLSLVWTGDYESLKQFINETFKLDGSWGQPGGDRKVYNVGDSKIVWKKNKGLLSFDGSMANDFKMEICKQLCKGDDDILDPIVVNNTDVDSSKLPADLYSDIKQIKEDQEINGEAIRSLSNSILNITSAISDFQNYMEKNNLGEEASTRPMNLVEKTGNGSQHYHAIETDANSCIPLDGLINSEEHKAEQTNQLDVLNKALSCRIGEQCTSSKDKVNEKFKSATEQESYAQVVKLHPDTIRTNKKSSMVDKCEKGERNQLAQKNTDTDGFIGVDRNRKKTKKFFLSGIHDSVKESQIFSYLEKRDIIPTYISVFRSQQRGTRSAKVHVPSSMALLVQTEKFWPEFVKCTPWQSKKVRNSTASNTIATHSGNYSSYV